MLACAFNRWSLRFGDPNFTGWLIVGAYTLTFLIVLATIRQVAHQSARRELAFWAFVAALLGLLGVNKQLDLQSLLTDAGRCIAKAHGWYGSRRLVQHEFVLALGVFGAGCLLFGSWLLRASVLRNGVGLVGMFTLTTFVFVRAASFHHIDQFIFVAHDGLKMNVALELGGIGLVALGALIRMRWRPAAAKRRPDRSRHR